MSNTWNDFSKKLLLYSIYFTLIMVGIAIMVLVL